MNRASACIAAASLLAGCYASHRLPPDGRDGGPPMDAPAPDAGEPLEPGICRQGCALPSDCSGRSLRTCEDGACYFVGCSSDADCPPTGGCYRELRQCRPRCETTADCPELGSDPGEVACMDGLCLFVGCPSDAWCDGYVARFDLEGTYRCVSRRAGTLPRCWRVCATEADCVTTGATHPSECASGFCQLAACTADTQCRSWHADDWVCAAR